MKKLLLFIHIFVPSDFIHYVLLDQVSYLQWFSYCIIPNSFWSYPSISLQKMSKEIFFVVFWLFNSLPNLILISLFPSIRPCIFWFVLPHLQHMEVMMFSHSPLDDSFLLSQVFSYSRLLVSIQLERRTTN